MGVLLVVGVLGLIFPLTYAHAYKPNDLLARHNLEPSGQLDRSSQALANPFAYKGQLVWLRGFYEKNIAPQEAFFSASVFSSLQLTLLKTSRNLAETEALGGVIDCIVEVQGVRTVSTLRGPMDVPEVEEKECNVGPFQWLRDEAKLKPDEAELAYRHSAISLKDSLMANMFALNPFPWEGKTVFLSGNYRKNISPTETLVDLWPDGAFPARGLSVPFPTIQLDTSRNLAGKGRVQCVVQVMGTKEFMEGLYLRRIPWVKVVECIQDAPKGITQNTAKLSNEPQALNSKVVVRHAAPPAYPQEALALGQEGTVVLRMVVTEKGLPKRIKIQKSSGYDLLDQSAKEAVNEWTFLPARRDGVPIKSVIEIPINFNLKKDGSVANLPSTNTSPTSKKWNAWSE